MERSEGYGTHEHYCAGHLNEGGVAYHQTMGKRLLPDVAIASLITLLVTKKGSAFNKGSIRRRRGWPCDQNRSVRPEPLNGQDPYHKKQ